jgi:dolichol kinase
MTTIADTEQLMEDKKPAAQANKSTFGVVFALIFCLGFGIALTYAAGSNWNKQCDRPLKAFLTGFGVTSILAFLVFLGLELSKKDHEEPKLTGFSLFAFWTILVLFFSFGTAGAILYFSSEDCDTLAAVEHRWTFAGVLAFLILAFLMSSSVAGKFGAPFFAIFGFGFANLFQFFANMFKSMAEVMSADGDPENKPVERSAGADFALFVNHATLMWFFSYILMQVHDEANEPCDRPLHNCLMGFGIYGLIVSYLDFLFEKFAGEKTREKLRPYFRFTWIINGVAYAIWGIYTAANVFSSHTCKDTAKDVYRLSFLLSCVFLVFCGFGVLGGCAGVLDFLCSGRLRFVVVVETGPNDEEEEFKAN